MSTQKQAQHQHHDAEEVEVVEPATDLADADLAEEVACCLAEIDKVLEETGKTEKERALEEYIAFWNAPHSTQEEAGELRRKIRIWRAQYAHLGLRTVESCCGIHVVDENGDVVA